MFPGHNLVMIGHTLRFLACVAGGIVDAREIKFWRRSARNAKSPSPFSSRLRRSLLAAPPPKLYFACVYNTASYTGYTFSENHDYLSHESTQCLLSETFTSARNWEICLGWMKVLYWEDVVFKFRLTPIRSVAY